MEILHVAHLVHAGLAKAQVVNQNLPFRMELVESVVRANIGQYVNVGCVFFYLDDKSSCWIIFAAIIS